jgi:hypothetical protein
MPLPGAFRRCVTPPRSEPDGRVAVFLGIAGNKWDLLGPSGADSVGEGNEVSSLDHYAVLGFPVIPVTFLASDVNVRF